MTEIKILGSGCPRCQSFEANARQAIAELGIEAKIEKVTDMAEIMGYGVMSTPGIVINGQLKGSGRLFSVEEIKGFLLEG